MSHTHKGGQASDQDSNSGPGRHGNNSGHIYSSALHPRWRQAHNWVTPSSPTPTLVDPIDRPTKYSQRITRANGPRSGPFDSAISGNRRQP